jgi:iron complex transport system substrate-binding protein
MKTIIIRTIFFGFLFGFLLIGCTLAPLNDLDLAPITEEQQAQPVEEPIEPNETISEARFTMMAEEEFKNPLTALYEAHFEGETPTFVEADADLSVITSPAAFDERSIIEKSFLPDVVMIPAVDSIDVINFIDFAISPDGQQVLIDAGELPAVISVTDMAGNSLEIQQPVRRVISAFGPTTSITYSVHAADRLVAASFIGAADPMGAASMERIDPRFPVLASDDYFSRQEFNIEHAATLDPDLIIASSRSTWLEAVDQLGIPVFLMEAETPEQLKEAVLLIGQLFGPHASRQAQAWVAYYDFVLDTVIAQIGEIPMDERVKVLFTGTEPLRVASGEMYQNDIILSAGGISVSADLGGYWNDVNLEQVVVWDPEVIIVPPYGGASVEAITDSAEWEIVEAVRSGRVYRMPRFVVPWDTPAPDSVLGIVWMAERLNPDRISITCKSEVEFFYNTFYNYSITTEEIMTLCP